MANNLWEFFDYVWTSVCFDENDSFQLPDKSLRIPLMSVPA